MSSYVSEGVVVIGYLLLKSQALVTDRTAQTFSYGTATWKGRIEVILNKVSAFAVSHPWKL